MNAPLGPIAKLDAHIFQRDAEDFYIDEPWISRALFAQEPFRGPIYDPACGTGNILAAASAAGYETLGSDIVNRSNWCQFEQSFLVDDGQHETIVCNPPYDKKIVDDFVRHALAHAHKVAMILPADWHIRKNRSLWMEKSGFYKHLGILPRPNMPPGHLIAQGLKPEGGRKDFAVYIWLRNYTGPSLSGLLRCYKEAASDAPL